MHVVDIPYNNVLQINQHYTILVDVDECQSPDSNDCHPNATCADTTASSCTDVLGRYNCTCNEGFTGNGTECQGEFIHTKLHKSLF